MDKTTQAPSGLGKQRILGIRRGIEKESLRTHSDAALAISPHPAALGSALTHPHITTDFSESQIELITGVHAGVQDCLDELRQVQKYTLQSMGSDMLWASSMPCEHLLPGLPYHALGEAHRRLVAALPQTSDYHAANYGNLSGLVVRLVKSSAARVRG